MQRTFLTALSKKNVRRITYETVEVIKEAAKTKTNSPLALHKSCRSIDRFSNSNPVVVVVVVVVFFVCFVFFLLSSLHIPLALSVAFQVEATLPLNVE